MKWYLKVIRQYTDFNGRARRKEYWMFFLFNMIFYYTLVGISIALLANQILIRVIRWIPMIYVLILLLPTLAVTVRRMHDVGKSGWFCIIPIYNFILAVKDGDKDDNEYGPDPKSENIDNRIDTLDGHLTN